MPTYMRELCTYPRHVKSTHKCNDYIHIHLHTYVHTHTLTSLTPFCRRDGEGAFVLIKVASISKKKKSLFSAQSYRLSHKCTCSDHTQAALPSSLSTSDSSESIPVHTPKQQHTIITVTFIPKILYLRSLQPSFHVPTNRTTAPAGHTDY